MGLFQASEAVEQLQKDSRFTRKFYVPFLIMWLFLMRAENQSRKTNLSILNKTYEDSKKSANNAASGIKNVAKRCCYCSSCYFNLNDEIDKLFKQSSSTVVTATATAAMAVGD